MVPFKASCLVFDATPKTVTSTVLQSWATA